MLIPKGIFGLSQIDDLLIEYRGFLMVYHMTTAHLSKDPQQSADRILILN